MPYAAHTTPAQLRKRGVKLARRTNKTFFTGKDALEEVAKEDGIWNWALVGADPETLPLSGGGNGGVEEMQSAVGRHPQSYGLLRMMFKADNGTYMAKYLFIHASDATASTAFSAVQRGQAAAMEPKMHKIMQIFVSFSVTAQFQSREECVPELMVEQLRSVFRGMAVGADLLTLERYHVAMEDFRNQSNEDEEKEVIARVMEKLAAPAPHIIDAAKFEQAEAPVEEKTVQRKRIKPFEKGDPVEVWSARLSNWVTDGEVGEMTKETIMDHGFKIRAGSVKVFYDNGSKFKWVPPSQIGDYLRRSLRPKSPPTMTGELELQQYTWLLPFWGKVYFEINRGYLQWWATKTAAENNDIPMGSLLLLNFEYQLMDTVFRIKTSAARSSVYSLKGESGEAAMAWIDALIDHASYCDACKEFFEAQRGGTLVRSELLKAVGQKQAAKQTGARVHKDLVAAVEQKHVAKQGHAMVRADLLNAVQKREVGKEAKDVVKTSSRGVMQELLQYVGVKEG